jgi:GNAT superfamily N-acetyltransferase
MGHWCEISEILSIYDMNENFIVIKFKQKDERSIYFWVFDKINLPNIEKQDIVEFYTNSIARAEIENNQTLSELRYRYIRNSIDVEYILNKIVLHLSFITVIPEYNGRGLGKKLVEFIMSILNTTEIYLHPTLTSINYWMHIGCEDTRYNYLYYDHIPLLKFISK